MKNVSVELVDQTAQGLRGLANGGPINVGIILGSGFGAYADTLADKRSMDFTSLGLPGADARGHAGVMHYAEIHGLGVFVQQGRIHYYEGHHPQEVVQSTRAMIRAGAKIIVVTCAAGSINRDLSVGRLVLLKSQVNRTGASPLTGQNVDEFGPRFPDMTYPYDLELRRIAVQAAEKQNITVGRGTYAMNPGPEYETFGEIEMLRHSGVDLVGMSTVFEVIAARHMSARVLGVACVTNLAAGIGENTLSHDEVLKVGHDAAGDFLRLMNEFLELLSKGV